jgi:hypothetical protein
MSVGAGGMTAGQYRDPKLALALIGLFTRPYWLQNGALGPRLEPGLYMFPGAIIGERSGKGWRAMVLDSGIDADSASSSARKGALKDANTLDMSNLSWLIFRGSCVSNWSALRSIVAEIFDSGSRRLDQCVTSSAQVIIVLPEM